MLEINRGVALLGPKTQECNTRDKQELGTSCRLDQTIGLLSSQTVLPPSGRLMLPAGDYPPLERSKQAGLVSVIFS
jgi:hypothetical protein